MRTEITRLSLLKTPYSAEPHPGRALEAPAKGEIEAQWACVCRAEALFAEWSRFAQGPTYDWPVSAQWTLAFIAAG